MSPGSSVDDELAGAMVEAIKQECAKAAIAITSTLRNRSLPRQRWFQVRKRNLNRSRIRVELGILTVSRPFYHFFFQILECAATILSTVRGLFSTEDSVMMLGVLEELEMEDMEGGDFDMDLDSASLSETMPKTQNQEKKSAKVINRAFEARKRNVIRQALLANISRSIIHET